MLICDSNILYLRFITVLYVTLNLSLRFLYYEIFVFEVLILFRVSALFIFSKKMVAGFWFEVYGGV